MEKVPQMVAMTAFKTSHCLLFSPSPASPQAIDQPKACVTSNICVIRLANMTEHKFTEGEAYQGRCEGGQFMRLQSMASPQTDQVQLVHNRTQ